MASRGIGTAARVARRACLVVLAAAALGGCGGDEETSEPPAPRLPRPLAESLSARSVTIAELLDQGDDCRARAEAVALRDDVSQAVAARRVPQELRPQLEATADRLLTEIACVEAPPVAGGEDDDVVEEEGEDEEGGGKGKKPEKDKPKKDKKGGKERVDEEAPDGDAPPVTEPDPAETTEPTTTQDGTG